MITSLQKDVTDVEVLFVIQSMHPLKVPRIDGLHALFYEKQWRYVGKFVINMVKGVFTGGDIPKGMNKTLLVLIPKVNNPESIQQFYSISLLNVFCKVITKLIAIPMKFALQ